MAPRHWLAHLLELVILQLSEVVGQELSRYHPAGSRCQPLGNTVEGGRVQGSVGKSVLVCVCPLAAALQQWAAAASE